VEINPEDAQRLNISTGEMVLLTSRRGKIEAPARVTSDVPQGDIFLPIHFGENPTNTLTSSTAFDPIAKIPEFKVGSVRVEKLLA
jgi:anaerobic selenocysteine-containing dehydrogenase